MMAVVIFGLGAIIATRRAASGVRVAAIGAAVLLALVVGLSRIYLGAVAKSASHPERRPIL